MNDKSNFLIERSKFLIEGSLIGTKSAIDFEAYQSLIIIQDGGNFIINMKVQCRDSKVSIKNSSSLEISSNGGEMVLRNTFLNNKFGSVLQKGNIYLNSGSSIINYINSTFNIFSNIYSSGDKNTNFTNNGSVFISNSDPIKVESPFINFGKLKTDFKQTLYLTSYNQQNGSTFNLQDESVLVSNQPLQMDGGMLYGNATFNTSIMHSFGMLGSFNDTCYIYINGDYTMSQYGVIYILINSLEDFTQIFIRDTAILKGDLEVKISNKISSKNLKQLNVVNFGDLDKYSNAFKRVRFRTFDPETGLEMEGNNCAQSISTDRSLSVLFRDCESPLSNSAIIGFCIGLVGTAVIVGAVYKYRKKITSTFNNNRVILKIKKRKTSDDEEFNNNNNNNNNGESNNMVSLDILGDNNNYNNENNISVISGDDNNNNNNNNMGVDLINNDNNNNSQEITQPPPLSPSPHY
ncbi:hypothetical protein DICPUDRAFT_151618 [Dictyostelium purpureum]|uniref:Uncharacterized protein n=1 Tax=Dictyostelium purpureum TaxID=5786 RepID=F0ZJA9_DICPU|nr:uncharacterized protein DICPUDRAFT_151618 [Dictyostelium purpureum]EGC35988.1 hypothetical protein DICPUDRAFT_151618 [Dictyostelium purpureum]|eukprot:XP_003287489.1 hypothetical protein DICPUDRAFT_151618 [Dictyostelium purpureum]